MRLFSVRKFAIWGQKSKNSDQIWALLAERVDLTFFSSKNLFYQFFKVHWELIGDNLTIALNLKYPNFLCISSCKYTINFKSSSRSCSLGCRGNPINMRHWCAPSFDIDLPKTLHQIIKFPYHLSGLVPNSVHTLMGIYLNRYLDITALTFLVATLWKYYSSKIDSERVLKRVSLVECPLYHLPSSHHLRTAEADAFITTSLPYFYPAYFSEVWSQNTEDFVISSKIRHP